MADVEMEYPRHPSLIKRVWQPDSNGIWRWVKSEQLLETPYDAMIGRKFGKLTVKRIFCFTKAHPLALCECECGRETTPDLHHIRSGHTRTCGCGQHVGPVKHGYAKKGKKTSTYWCWASIKNRCSNPNFINFKHYGGRGIRVCERWRKSFSNFLSDMGERPPDKTSIERRDNDGDYCPENCYWATASEQSLNTRRNHKITFDGITLPLTSWSKKVGINRYTIFIRLKRGWSVEDALTTPRRVTHSKKIP